MSILCTLEGEPLSSQLPGGNFDMRENDLLGWLNLIEGNSHPGEFLTSNERETLSSFFGTAKIRIFSSSKARPSMTCFSLYMLFYVKSGERLFILKHREGNGVALSMVERKDYLQFQNTNDLTDLELDAHIVCGHLRRISPEVIGDFLSHRWPSEFTTHFSYLYRNIPIVILFSRQLFWYGIHEAMEISTPLVKLKIMNFNYIKSLIIGYNERKFVTFDSEAYFGLSKCCVCLEEKFCSSLCGKAKPKDFLTRIPDSDVVMMDLFRIRKGEMGHMVCADCKTRWRDSSAGRGCPICRAPLYTLDLHLSNELKSAGNRTSFHLYMLVRMICLNMLSPENILLDKRLSLAVKAIIHDFPRSDLISVDHYNSFLLLESNTHVSDLEVGMIFGHFGGACIDLDYMLFRRYTVEWGGHALASLGLRYLRSNRMGNLTARVEGFEVVFRDNAFNLLYDIHVANILSDVFEDTDTYDGRQLNAGVDEIRMSLHTWFRRTIEEEPVSLLQPHYVRDLYNYDDSDDLHPGSIDDRLEDTMS